MVKKTCYLHVGFPKTSSTSFQRTCANNIEKLDKQGITYPCFKFDGKEWYNHSLILRTLFSEEPEKIHKNIILGYDINMSDMISKCEDQFKNLSKKSQNILLSGEGVSIMDKNSLSNLKRKLESYGYNLKVAAFVRHPYGHLCSNIQEKIKAGWYINLISLNNTVPSTFNTKWYSKVNNIRDLKSIFGADIKFYSFDEACLTPYGPVGFLFGKFLNQEPSNYQYKKRNESIFNLTARFFNELNKNNPVLKNGKKNPNYIKPDLQVNGSFKYSGKFLLTKEEFSVVKEYVEKEAKNTNKLIGTNFTSSNIKFSEPIY